MEKVVAKAWTSRRIQMPTVVTQAWRTSAGMALMPQEPATSRKARPKLTVRVESKVWE